MQKHCLIAQPQMKHKKKINGWTKEMILDGESTSQDLNSLYLLPGKKHFALIDGEYVRQQLHYDSKEINVENNSHRSHYSHGLTPKMEYERTIIYECVVSFFSEEVYDRKSNINGAKKFMGKLTEKLVDSDLEQMSTIVGNSKIT